MKMLVTPFKVIINEVLKSVFALIILLCISSPGAYSQSGCDNGNFEFGNFTNWTGATGLNTAGLTATVNDLVVFTPTVLPYGTYNSPPTNAINLVPPGTDPTVPFITTTHLASGNAARIGNVIPSYGLDQLAKTFVVDATTSNFSFWYALILQDPSHPYDSQPFFIVRVRNSAGVIVPSLGIILVSDPTNPFFQSPPNDPSILYRDWDCINLDLSSLAGEQVTVEFITGDCGAGAHWGYAYIDDICLGCDGSPTGDCSLDRLPNDCNNFPLQVCGTFTLPQPPQPATASLDSITLKIYQNGIQVGSTITGPAIIGNSFCFTLNASDFPAVPPDGFDFVASANFLITSATSTTNITKNSGTPGNGITPGSNNDYKVNCEDTTCIRILRDTTYCDSTGTYIYEFQVFNNSPSKYVEQLELAVDSPQPPNYVVAIPSTFNVTPPLPPLSASQVYKVKLIGPGAVSFSEVCYTLSAQYLQDDCPWCCFIENCIKLPICSCAEVLRDSIYCVDGDYFYNFSLQNGTEYNVTKIQLTSPGTSIAFVPQIIHFNTPIAPGQLFPNQTVQILGGVVGMQLPIRIKLFSGDFECCYIELTDSLPQCDAVNMNLRSFIQARYNDVTNLMRGDTISVELRNSYAPFSLVETSRGYLNDSGNCSLKFNNAQNNVNYYIVIKHRNSIETWSKTPGQSFSSDELDYNFLSQQQAFGQNLSLIDTSPMCYGIPTGDINQDGIVDVTDLLNVFNDAIRNSTGYILTDITGEGYVDLSDMIVTYNNSSAFVSVGRP